MNMPLRFAIAAILSAVVISSLPVAQAGIADDPEVVALKEKVEAAEDQGKLNLISKELCDLLDARMKAVETQIRKKLDEGALALFDESAKAWRAYRSAQVRLEGSFYQGGSIQPLVHNQAYSALTETHIDELIKFRDDSLEEH